MPTKSKSSKSKFKPAKPTQEELDAERLREIESRIKELTHAALRVLLLIACAVMFKRWMEDNADTEKKQAKQE